MKGDPLRGVHAFYAASAREWWAPLYPLRRVLRRNALVAALDKPSEFAGRAIHEWTAQVFRDDDGRAALGPVPADGADRAREGARAQEVRRRRAPRRTPTTRSTRSKRSTTAERARGAEPRWWEDVEEGDEVGPMVKGPLTVTDMVCWHSGHGHGALRREAAAARLPEPQAHPALLPPRRPQRPRRDAARALGSRVRAPVRQPDDVRLRPHARDVAHPPLHRLDGRRRVAVEARVRVPRSSTTSATRSGCAARVVRKYLRRRRPARGRPRARRREPARRGRRRPGTATILLPSREHGPVRLPDPPGGARDLARARSTRSRPEFSRADDRASPVPTPTVSRSRSTAACCACTLDRPEKRNAISDAMMRA